MSDTASHSQTIELEQEIAREDEAASTVLTPHMRGLDVLRGIAILLVLIYHGFLFSAPRLVLGTPTLQSLYLLTGWGWLGVNLFFVISGFLITGILQDSRSSPQYFQRFYTRRALRILPAYLVTLFLLWGFHLVRLPYLVICVLFLANMPGLLLPAGTALYGPLWSLAVEEQFYLVWPWLNRWIGRLGMLGVCVLLMLTCPVLRWLAAVHVLHTGEPGSKTWMIADNLAIGAVLALLARTPRVTRKQFAAIGTMFLVIGAAGITWILKTGGIYEPLGRSVGLSCFMFFGAAMVTWAVCWYRVRPVPKAFSFLLFLGRISYGLYLIHMLCLALYDRAFGTAWQHDFRKLLLRFLVGYSIAIGLAWVSRETYEEWFLCRGHRVPARRVRARSAASTT